MEENTPTDDEVIGEQHDTPSPSPQDKVSNYLRTNSFILAEYYQPLLPNMFNLVRFYNKQQRYIANFFTATMHDNLDKEEIKNLDLRYNSNREFFLQQYPNQHRHNKSYYTYLRLFSHRHK